MNGKCAEEFAEEYTHGTCENHLVWCGEVCCEETLGGTHPYLVGKSFYSKRRELHQAHWKACFRNPCGDSVLSRGLYENLPALPLMSNTHVWPQCKCSQDISSFIISCSLSKTLINTRGKSTLHGNHYHCNLTHRQQFSESRRCVRYGNTIPLLVRDNKPITYDLSGVDLITVQWDTNYPLRGVNILNLISPGTERCHKETRQGMNVQRNSGEFEEPLMRWKRKEYYTFWKCVCSPVIQLAKHMRCITLSSVDCLARPYFSHIIS